MGRKKDGKEGLLGSWGALLVVAMSLHPSLRALGDELTAMRLQKLEQQVLCQGVLPRPPTSVLRSLQDSLPQDSLWDSRPSLALSKPQVCNWKMRK